MSKIKLCGMFRQVDIEAVNAVKPDYVGFIIDYPKSHRNVTIDELKVLSSLVDEGIQKVGVFVNAQTELVISLLNENVLDMAQLHGDEDDAYIRRIREATGKPVIKAVQIIQPGLMEIIDTCPADYLLIDSGKGSGMELDVSRLPQINRPFFLAGGIQKDNITRMLLACRPYAVDLSSGIETDGLKDAFKMKEITNIVRSFKDEEGDSL